MYLNTYAVEHVFWSQTRAWMAVVMGAGVSIIMLAFMLRMYSQGTLNLAIFVGGAVVFAAALWLVRSQATVDDVDYMKAMIPHHSIAVMTSNGRIFAIRASGTWLTRFSLRKSGKSAR